MEILKFLQGRSDDLILLPGARNDFSEPKEIQKILQPGVHIFIENGLKKFINFPQKSTGIMRNEWAIPYVITDRTIRQLPKQVFSNHPKPRDIDEWINILPDRIFSIANKNIIFILCGELIAFNPDGTLKHRKRLPQLQKIDIIANPAHSVMGHWNWLGDKFVSLSKGRICLYTANNNKNNSTITTDVRIYRDGNLLPLENRMHQNGLTWIEIDY